VTLPQLQIPKLNIEVDDLPMCSYLLVLQRWRNLGAGQGKKDDSPSNLQSGAALLFIIKYGST